MKDSYDLKRLSIADKDLIQYFFKEVFTKEPWNDDWSDDEQLDQYIMELVGNPNSLTLGFFEDEKMIGLAMGYIRHWYEGTEYHIDELCISTNMQGKGIGTEFIRQIADCMGEKGLAGFFCKLIEICRHMNFIKKEDLWNCKTMCHL